MFAIIAAVLLSIVFIMCILLILGAPLGEFTMGGRYKILPKKLRIVAVIMLFVQYFAISLILQAGGYVALWFSKSVTRTICYIFAGYFFFNTFMNFFSTSKKEKYTMTPMSIISAICYIVTALQM